uniref:proto-oncogene Mas-like n=1 Tax=Euleptes europaea TaxID=460621 RepID=UPI00254185E5|nr:proto-oncogene Mas-like [Euleptes europaea]
MTDFSKTSLSPVEYGPQYGDIYSKTSSSVNIFSAREEHSIKARDIMYIFFPCISIIGLVGNGIVFCFLGFHIKRSPFTTYVLNLAVADFGVLLFGTLLSILKVTRTRVVALNIIVPVFISSTYGASQLLLTSISIDRCLSVLFPIWYRCHRPPRLSAIVCALIWALSCLSSGSQAILYGSWYILFGVFSYQFIVGAVLCLPLVTVSTMILLFKVYCKSQHPHRGKILTIILLTLLCFLIFAFPLNAIYTVYSFTYNINHYVIAFGLLCVCLNSCVNPVIYYLVGRKKRGQQRQSMKVILQRAFKEEEGQREEQGTTAQTPL